MMMPHVPTQHPTFTCPPHPPTRMASDISVLTPLLLSAAVSLGHLPLQCCHLVWDILPTLPSNWPRCGPTFLSSPPTGGPLLQHRSNLANTWSQVMTTTYPACIPPPKQVPRKRSEQRNFKSAQESPSFCWVTGWLHLSWGSYTRKHS